MKIPQALFTSKRKEEKRLIRKRKFDKEKRINQKKKRKYIKEKIINNHKEILDILNRLCYNKEKGKLNKRKKKWRSYLRYLQYFLEVRCKMSLPILPDYIPDTTGSLHDEIKIRNMNVVISLIHNNPSVFGNDLEKALVKMRAYGMLTDYNEFAIMPDMSINTIMDVNKFNELNFLDIDFLSTPVVE